MKNKFSAFSFVLFLISATGTKAQPSVGHNPITAFKQGDVAYDAAFAKCIKNKKWGNCVATAISKDALAQFGDINNVYSSYLNNGGTIDITFADGIKITLSPDEISLCRNMARFAKITDPVFYNNAIIIYCSICKRILVKKSIADSNAQCINTLTDAANFINAGYGTPRAGALLGLNLVEKDLSQLVGLNACIIESAHHTTFCSKGMQDWFGKAHRIRANLMLNANGIGNRITHVYVLSK